MFPSDITLQCILPRNGRATPITGKSLDSIRCVRLHNKLLHGIGLRVGHGLEYPVTRDMYMAA